MSVRCCNWLKLSTCLSVLLGKSLCKFKPRSKFKWIWWWMQCKPAWTGVHQRNGRCCWDKQRSSHGEGKWDSAEHWQKSVLTPRKQLKWSHYTKVVFWPPNNISYSTISPTKDKTEAAVTAAEALDPNKCRMTRQHFLVFRNWQIIYKCLQRKIIDPEIGSVGHSMAWIIPGLWIWSNHGPFS